MSRKPLDFLVIGAQKCATSWLYYCLRDHPQLHLPSKKREVEYLGGDLYQIRGADWYFSLFRRARDTEKIGAVSVEYIRDPRSPATIHQYAPDVRLIVSLRNPVDRALSAYFWYIRTGQIPFRSLQKGLGEALDGGLKIGRPEAARIQDVLTRGFYDVQLERYLAYFSPERFLFLRYEDIQTDPLAAVRKCYAFIGVDSSVRPQSLNTKPKRTTFLAPVIRVERLAAGNRILGKGLDWINQLFFRMEIGSRPPEIPADLRKRIEDLYRPHMKRTEAIIRLSEDSHREGTGKR